MEPTRNSDFVSLVGSDEYAKYFRTLTHACELVTQFYQLCESHETYEANRILDFMRRFLYTVRILRMKYLFDFEDRRLMWIDLSDSGFPNAQEIEQLQIDLGSRTDTFQRMLTADLLKELILDHLIRECKDPKELLLQMAQRVSLEMMDTDRMILPFMILGEPVSHPIASKATQRKYLCSWSAYDASCNRPFVYVMTFEQDAREEPLEERRDRYREFMQVIRFEGCRAADIGIMAMNIDNAIESIHPKILKRIGFGPLYSRELMEREDTGAQDAEHQAMLVLLSYAQPHESVLVMTDELVFSRKQSLTRSLLAPGGRVREIFHIPETDTECYERRASVIHRVVVMPHPSAQHIDATILAAIPSLKTAKLLTYDRRGVVLGL